MTNANVTAGRVAELGGASNSGLKLGFVDSALYGSRGFDNIKNFTEENITKLAQDLCIQRDYPKSLAIRNNSSLII